MPRPWSTCASSATIASPVVIADANLELARRSPPRSARRSPRESRARLGRRARGRPRARPGRRTGRRTASPMNFSTTPPCCSSTRPKARVIGLEQCEHVLGVERLGPARRADDVDEDRRDRSPLLVRRPGARVAAAGPLAGAPQLRARSAMQNCATPGLSAPHVRHVRESGVPHARQNLAISGFSVAHDEHTGIARVYGERSPRRRRVRRHLPRNRRLSEPRYSPLRARSSVDRAADF